MAKEELVRGLREFFYDIISNQTDSENAIEFLTLIYSESEFNLAELLSQRYSNTVVFIPLIKMKKHQDLSKLLIHLIELNGKILTMPLDINGPADDTLINLILKEPEKYKEIMRWLTLHKSEHLKSIQSHDAIEEGDELFQIAQSSIDLHQIVQGNSLIDQMEHQQTPIISRSTLNALTLPEKPIQINKQLKQFVNIKCEIDSVILDAYAFQTFHEKLMSQGIILMPTTRSSEPIGIELLTDIKTRKNILYTSDTEILRDNVESVLTEHPITQDIRYALWPIHRSNQHYGLLILDLNNADALHPSRGYYIEPLRRNLREIVPGINALADHEMQSKLSSFFYKKYVQTLTQHLKMNENAFSYICLGQHGTTNFCSDFVLAVLARLASGEIDLIHNPESLFSLEANHLTDDDVRTIRSLQIQRFGNDYFKVQLSDEFKRQLSTNQSIDPAQLEAMISPTHFIDEEVALQTNRKSLESFPPFTTRPKLSTTKQEQNSFFQKKRSKIDNHSPNEIFPSSIVPETHLEFSFEPEPYQYLNHFE